MKSNNKKKGEASDESDRDDDNKSDKSDNSNEPGVDTDNSPKIIPVAKLPEKLKTKKIVINISDTQYPIIQQIAQQLGWTVERQEGIGDWDLWWTDRQITPDTLFRMNLHQKINHFPGIYVLARKNMLGLNLMAMRDKFQVQYDFFPQTWVIPLQFAKFRAYFESAQKGKTRTYIVKPQALSQGRGIFLTRNIQDIMNGRKYVVQRYLKNPLLIDQLKFDLRIYVLLAGTDPLRLYLYEQGLTRFATRKYQQPTDQNLHTSFIHLTNYSLNKKNPEYVYNTSEQDMNVGHKRSLTSTYEYLAKKGYDVRKLKGQIQDVIIKTIIAGLPAISHQYQYCQPEEYENNMCFHILGVDIMINSELKPYLIQINHTPSFETGTPLDYKVKKNLIIDTLKIMRITAKNKRLLFQKAKQLVKKRIQTGKRQIVKGQRRQQFLAEAQKKRDKQQAGLLGGFKKIFPLQDDPEKMQQYNKMIQHAEQVHKQTQQTRKKLIRQQQQKMKAKKKNGSQSQNKDHKTQRNSMHHNTSQKVKVIRQTKQLKQIKIIKQQDTLIEQKAITTQNQTVYIHKQLHRQRTTQKTTTTTQLQHQSQHQSQKQTITEFVQTSNLITSQKIIQKNVHTSSTTNPSANSVCAGGKNCNFRTKTKKNVYNPKQQFIKFSQFMVNYIANKNVNGNGRGTLPNSVEADQQAFSNLKKYTEIKRKDNNSYQREREKQKDKEKQKQREREREKNKQGAYIIPKMYQIIDSKAAIRIEIQLAKKNHREKQVGSPQICQSQKLNSIISYKGMHKRKRFSIY